MKTKRTTDLSAINSSLLIADPLKHLDPDNRNGARLPRRLNNPVCCPSDRDSTIRPETKERKRVGTKCSTQSLLSCVSRNILTRFQGSTGNRKFSTVLSSLTEPHVVSRLTIYHGHFPSSSNGKIFHRRLTMVVQFFDIARKRKKG